MALIQCPECDNSVSEMAAACPHCGCPVEERFGPSSQLQPPQEQPADTAESDFKDAALQIVGTCDRALNSPRMYIESIVAEARSQLDRLRAKYSQFLDQPKYKDVDSYLFACVIYTEMAKRHDDHACEVHGAGGLVGGIMGFVADLQTGSEIDRVNAYMHDIRIMLGAMPGSPTAVKDLGPDPIFDEESNTPQSESSDIPQPQRCSVGGHPSAPPKPLNTETSVAKQKEPSALSEGTVLSASNSEAAQNGLNGIWPQRARSTPPKTESARFSTRFKVSVAFILVSGVGAILAFNWSTFDRSSQKTPKSQVTIARPSELDLLRTNGPSREVIASACEKQAEKSWAKKQPLEKDILRGSKLISEGPIPPKGTSIYPIRVIYHIIRAKPVLWDQDTGLPRIPPESEVVRACGEFRFHQNEFGEWVWVEIEGLSCIDPPVKEDPRTRNRGAISEAYNRVDLGKLERLLEESQKKDQANGGAESYETLVRRGWVDTARDLRKIREEFALAEKDHEEAQRRDEIFNELDFAMMDLRGASPQPLHLNEQASKYKHKEEVYAALLKEAPKLIDGWVADAKNKYEREKRRMEELVAYEDRNTAELRAGAESLMTEQARREARLGYPAKDEARHAGHKKYVDKIQQEYDRVLALAKSERAKLGASAEADDDSNPHLAEPPKTIQRDAQNSQSTPSAIGGTDVTQDAPPSLNGQTNVDPATFVKNFVESLGSDDLESLLPYYAERVQYFNSGRITKDAVGRDLQRDIVTWPNRTYSIQTAPKITLSADGFTAEFAMTYTLRNNKGGANSGKMEMQLRATLEGQRPQIVEIQGRRDGTWKAPTESNRIEAAQKARTPVSAPPAVPQIGPGLQPQTVWIFPDSSSRVLDQSELAPLDAESLWRARNEIYARNGFIFSGARAKAFADALGAAYRGVDADPDRVFGRMNKVEKTNVDLIKSFEARKR